MTDSLAPGLLVAAQSVREPAFRRSVVLLVEHRAEGSFGFVVNRPLARSVADVLDDLSLDAVAGGGFADKLVLEGGPVAPSSGWLLYAPGGAFADVEGSVTLDGELAISASRDLLEAIARGDGPSPYQLVLGHAGWGPGQLDAELAAGAWLPVGLDVSVLFSTPSEDRWARSLRTAGIDPGRLVAPAGDVS